MNEKMDHLASLTKSLIESIGEDPNREGLIKTPQRVAKSWDYFSKGYREKLDDVINEAIFNEDCSDMVVVRDIEKKDEPLIIISHNSQRIKTARELLNEIKVLFERNCLICFFSEAPHNKGFV